MILVTVGSVAPFDELIKKVDLLAGAHGEARIKEPIMQIGNGKYIPKNGMWFRFEPDLSRYYRNAELIITHNGAGTLFEILPLGKKVIVVPNPNTVQLENIDIVIKLAKEGHIIPCLKVEDIESALKKAENWIPLKYEKPTCTMHKLISRHLLSSKEKRS
ncbi:MAG: hypothetical protein NO516_06560 [Candidatus Methanomethylicia archaeon]|nr:hypothetical protein [Candidatus Methanomethylicia archaeon]